MYAQVKIDIQNAIKEGASPRSHEAIVEIEESDIRSMSDEARDLLASAAGVIDAQNTVSTKIRTQLTNVHLPPGNVIAILRASIGPDAPPVIEATSSAVCRSVEAWVEARSRWSQERSDAQARAIALASDLPIDRLHELPDDALEALGIRPWQRNTRALADVVGRGSEYDAMVDKGRDRALAAAKARLLALPWSSLEEPTVSMRDDIAAVCSRWATPDVIAEALGRVSDRERYLEDVEAKRLAQIERDEQEKKQLRDVLVRISDQDVIDAFDDGVAHDDEIADLLRSSLLGDLPPLGRLEEIGGTVGEIRCTYHEPKQVPSVVWSEYRRIKRALESNASAIHMTIDTRLVLRTCWGEPEDPEDPDVDDDGHITERDYAVEVRGSIAGIKVSAKAAIE